MKNDEEWKRDLWKECQKRDPLFSETHCRKECHLNAPSEIICFL